MKPSPAGLEAQASRFSSTVLILLLGLLASCRYLSRVDPCVLNPSSCAPPITTAPSPPPSPEPTPSPSPSQTPEPTPAPSPAPTPTPQPSPEDPCAAMWWRIAYADDFLGHRTRRLGSADNPLAWNPVVAGDGDSATLHIRPLGCELAWSWAGPGQVVMLPWSDADHPDRRSDPTRVGVRLRGLGVFWLRACYGKDFLPAHCDARPIYVVDSPGIRREPHSEIGHGEAPEPRIWPMPIEPTQWDSAPQPSPTPRPTPSPSPTPGPSPPPDMPENCDASPLYHWGVAGSGNCFAGRHGERVCTVDTTPKFIDAAGRRGPCNEEHNEVCGGRLCEDPRGPIFSVTGTDRWQVENDGYAAKVWLRGRGISITACPRRDLQDRAGKSVGVVGPENGCFTRPFPGW